MAYEHPSGLPSTYDRADDGPNRQMVLLPEGKFFQGADFNEAQTIGRRRQQRIGNMVAKDGDRVDGADISVDQDSGTVGLAAGRIYARGDVRPVAAATLSGVSMTGNVQVGIKIQTTLVTWEDDPSLKGLEPGALSEGQPGAARIEETAVWALADDAQIGDFFPVYLLADGTPVDQTQPPALQGILAALALYDEQANGHYIVDGCTVRALGKIGTDQIFSIEKGTANIRGWKRTREYALRFAVAEDPDLEAVAAEPSTYTAADNAATIVTVQRPPIAAVTSVIIVKRVTELVVRGPVPGGLDALAHGSVVAIETITQGATTYAPSTDYVLSSGNVSWAPGGAEPASASTYSVTYLYNASVVPDAVTSTQITVSGGVHNQPILASYNSKLPRIDLMCLDISGLPVYVKGLSARQGAVEPPTPSTLLKLGTVANDWLAAPVVDNDGTHNYTYDRMRRYFDRLVDILDQFDRSELSRDIMAREPVSKNGIFTDNFVDDFYRDQGASQTAACNQGTLQLAIDEVQIERVGSAVEFLAYTEEVVVGQLLATSGMAINPYDNFIPLPADLKIEPPTDYWTDHLTDWTSPVTMEFTAAPDQPPGTTTVNVVVQEDLESAVYLRQIPIHFKIAGFGVGENLATLTFDGVDVKPAGTQTADANGEIEDDFTIPALMPVGTRRLRADGAAGSYAEALFHGEGVIDITTMQRVTLVTREAAKATPPAPVVTQVTNRVVTTAQTSNGPSQFDLSHGSDPLAQTFTLIEGRQIVGVNIKFTAIGVRSRGVRVQLAKTLNGYPTKEILAEAFINMTSINIGDVVPARFAAPVYLSPLAEYAFVVMTDDPTHALAIAKLGDVDQSNQSFVSANPYTVGVMLSSSNRSTWTPHNDADLWFQIIAAKFTATSKTVDLWTGALVNVSDFIVRGTVDIPTADARMRYEIVRASGEVIQLAPDQNYAAAEFINETVTLRAILNGSDKISPILYPGSTLICGRIRTTGTYITRVFPMGTAVSVKSLFAAFLPAGSGVTVDVDAANNTWVAMTAGATGTLGSGWTEPSFAKTGYTAAGGGRVRLSLSGGPAARPSLARMRAYSL